jgi:hypothetical protein
VEYPIRTSEALIVTSVYRSRWWWAPATVAAVTVVSALQMIAEMLYLGRNTVDPGSSLGSLLAVHAIGGAVCAVIFGIVAAARSGGRPSSLPYAERFLIGIGYGIATSIAIWIGAGILAAESFGGAVEAIGTFLTASIITLELPVACIVGGLAWHLLTKARSSAPPARPRRPIEDPE